MTLKQRVLAIYANSRTRRLDTGCLHAALTRGSNLGRSGAQRTPDPPRESGRRRRPRLRRAERLGGGRLRSLQGQLRRAGADLRPVREDDDTYAGENPAAMTMQIRHASCRTLALDADSRARSSA